MYKITATIWDWNVNYLPFLHLSRLGGGGERAWCSTLIMNVVCVYTLGLGGRGGRAT